MAASVDAHSVVCLKCFGFQCVSVVYNKIVCTKVLEMCTMDN